MIRAAALALSALACTGCAPVGAARQSERIVSIDYCADQAVLGLVARHRIAAVSAEADTDPGYTAPRARGLPRTGAGIERILALRPTLVVRSYGGGPRMEAALRRAGVPVLTLPYAMSPQEVAANLRETGRALRAGVAADAAMRRWNAALTRAQRAREHRVGGDTASALYVTPGNVTAGPDAFVMQLAALAGWPSFARQTGWHRLPVEELASRRPALVIRGFFDSHSYRQDRWSASGHALVRRRLADVPVAQVPGYAIACNNWLSADALDAMTVRAEAL